MLHARAQSTREKSSMSSAALTPILRPTRSVRPAVDAVAVGLGVIGDAFKRFGSIKWEQANERSNEVRVNRNAA
jgi:hypothetical protein